MKVIITVNIISFIGGIETWLYNLTHQLSSSYDIMVLYDEGDTDQVTRLNRHVNVKRINPSHDYTCDICIIGSTVTPFYNNIKADRYIQMIHCDFEHISTQYFIKRDIPNIEYVTVSESSRISFKKHFKKDSLVLKNPMDITRKPKRVLHLISCTRLSEEKGYSRMKILADKLRSQHIPFDWKIFTDLTYYNQEKIDYPEIIYMKPSLDVIDYIAEADYGVQLSDTESFCYFIHECIQYKTPVIVTDLPCLKDINFVDNVHGYIVDFNMKSLDVQKIYNRIPKCEIDINEESTIKEWKQFLGNSNTPTKLRPMVKIRITKPYYDCYFKKDMIVDNKIIEVPDFRAYELCNIHKYAVRVKQ